MNKFFSAFIFALGLGATAFGQEQAVTNQYHLFPILVNPGYTGFNDKHEFLLNARRTWTGFTGTPSTYTVMYSGPVGDKLALGGGILNEQVGDMNTLRLQINYAFRFRIQKARFGLGLSTEFLRNNVDNSLLSNPLVDPNDETLENAATGRKYFDASVGVHMLYDERFFLSLSMPNTVRARLDEIPTVQTEEPKRSLFEFYIFQMGYVANVASQNFKVIPSIALRKIRTAPFQVDFNVQGRFLEDKLITGLTFRPTTQGAMAFLLGTKFKQVQLLYTYDVSFGNFQSYNSGSHELSLAFALDRKKAKPAAEPNEMYGQ